MRREFLSVGLAPDTMASTERTVDIIWFSGIDVPRFDFWTGEEWILRLPMEKARIDRLNNGAPLMKDHSYSRPVDKQVGVFEKAWIEDGIGKATVRFAKSPDVDPLWMKVEQGILQNISMEASIDDFEDVTPRGQKTPKILQATGWEVEAAAIVPVGADPNAGFLAQASPLTMPPKERAFPFAFDLDATVANIIAKLSTNDPADSGAASITEPGVRFNPNLILALMRKHAAE